MATEYIALKRMQVHELDEEGEPRVGEGGRPILRQLAPGDPIPEAEHWNNLWREVKAGRVGMKGTALAGIALADGMRRNPDRAPRARAKSGKGKGAKRKAVERPRSRKRLPIEMAEPEQPVADVAPRSAGVDPDIEE